MYKFKVTTDEGTEREIVFAKPSWSVTKLIWEQVQADKIELAIEAAFTNLCNAEDRQFLMENGAAVFQIANAGLIDKITTGCAAVFISPSKGQEKMAVSRLFIQKKAVYLAYFGRRTFIGFTINSRRPILLSP